MRLEINTDGFSKGTKILINGKEYNDVVEFSFSLKHPGKVKMRILEVDKVNQMFRPSSFFGSDIQRLDMKFSNLSTIGNDNKETIAKSEEVVK